MEARILVPLDGSRLAEQALSYAMTLGRGLPAELVLFRAVAIPSDVQEALDKAGLKAGPLLERLETDANDYLAAMSHLLPQTGLRFNHVVRHGAAADAILDFVRQTDIRLIVMASHGNTGIRRWRYGSVAERVLQSASVPVLLVRAEEGDSEAPPAASPCRRILVPLDGSKVAGQVLPAVTPIARALGCELTLLKVLVARTSGPFAGEGYMPLDGAIERAEQDAHAYLEYLAGDLREQGIGASTATRLGPVAETIVDYAQANEIDLIAMCTHGRTGIVRWALGSVADRVLRAGGKPILLVRAK